MKLNSLRSTATLLVSAAVAVVVSCTSEETTPARAVTTTSATVESRTVHRVATTRCRRAAECNRIGAGQMYQDKQSCLDEETRSASEVVRSCAGGVDPKRVDHCIDSLENQYCDADMGPVTAMPDCQGYCRRSP